MLVDIRRLDVIHQRVGIGEEEVGLLPIPRRDDIVVDPILSNCFESTGCSKHFCVEFLTERYDDRVISDVATLMHMECPQLPEEETGG